MSVRQPIFLTIRVGSLAVPKRNVDEEPAMISLVCLGPGQLQTPHERVGRYFVTGTSENSESIEAMDLVSAPGELDGSTDGDEFKPGSLICPRRSLFFTPDQLPHQVDLRTTLILCAQLIHLNI